MRGKDASQYICQHDWHFGKRVGWEEEKQKILHHAIHDKKIQQVLDEALIIINLSHITILHNQ